MYPTRQLSRFCSSFDTSLRSGQPPARVSCRPGEHRAGGCWSGRRPKGGYMKGGEAGYQKERLSPGRIALLEG